MTDGIWASKFVEWAEDVWHDAGITPTEEQVREMASTAAWITVKESFIPYAQTRGPDVARDFRAALMSTPGVEPRDWRTFLSSYDRIHRHFIDIVEIHDDYQGAGYEKGMTARIHVREALKAMKANWTAEVRQNYGTPDSKPIPRPMRSGDEPASTASPAGAAAAGGCLIPTAALLIMLALLLVLL